MSTPVPNCLLLAFEETTININESSKNRVFTALIECCQDVWLECSNPSLSAILIRSFPPDFELKRRLGTRFEMGRYLGVDIIGPEANPLQLIRAAARFFCGVPHTHLLGVCCPDHFFLNRLTVNRLLVSSSAPCRGCSSIG